MAQLATTTIYGDLIVQRDITLQSNSLTIRIPSNSTSWSGGVTFYTSDGATLIGGFGLSKSPSAVQHLYMAHGSNPASSGYGIYVVPSGNVGIGTTNPAYKLDVAGDIRFTGTLQGGTVPWARLSGVPTASTSQAGIVQLNNTVTSTSTTQAATANAVKTAYDTAAARVAKSGDTMTGNLMFSGGTRYIGTSDSNNFVIRTANTDRIAIASNGNVGIGTASPSSKLHVTGNILVESGSIGLKHTSHQHNVIQAYASDVNGLTLVIQGGGPTIVGSGEAGMAAAPNIAVSEESLFLVSDNSIKLISGMQNGWSSRQEAITITSSGNVGFGTASPVCAFHVARSGNMYQTLQSTDSGYARLWFQRGSTWIGSIGSTASGVFSIHAGSSDGSTIVLTTSGNVGIGTTSPAQRLHVMGNIRVGDGSTSNMPIRYVSNDGVSYRVVLPVGPNKWAT